MMTQKDLHKMRPGMLAALWFVIVLAGCASTEVVHLPGTPQEKPPAVEQKDVYEPAEYQGQVPASTHESLKKQYPPGFWKQGETAIPPEQRRTIAIREFSGLTQPPELGKMVAEIFTTTFAKTGAFNLVERQQLEKVLSEYELNQSGAIDKTSAQQLGGLTGVDAIVSGSISQIGADQRIDARVIDIATGQVVLAETLTAVFNIQGTNLQPVDAQRIDSLARKMANQLINRYYR